jgi:hypothetical protein
VAAAGERTEPKLLTACRSARSVARRPEQLSVKRGTQTGPLHLLPIDRAEAIAEETSFAEVVNLPWSLYQDQHRAPTEKRPRTMPEPHDYPRKAGDSTATIGLKTLKTQTILACSSHLSDGVVAGTLRVLFKKTHFENFNLPAHPPADQTFRYQMHDAAHAFHKGGPQPGFITSPFIVGALALILGQVLIISSQVRERNSQRFVKELRSLVSSADSPAVMARQPALEREDGPAVRLAERQRALVF